MPSAGNAEGIAPSIQMLLSIIQQACAKKTCKIEKYLDMVVITLVIYFIASLAEVELRDSRSAHHGIVNKIRLLVGSLAVVLLVLILDILYFGHLLLSLWISVFIRLIWKSNEELIALLRRIFDSLKKSREELIALLRGIFDLLKNIGRDALCGSEATDHSPRDENGRAHGIADEGYVEQLPISRS